MLTLEHEVEISKSKEMDGFGFYKCFECGSCEIEPFYNYCPFCGVKFKWVE